MPDPADRPASLADIQAEFAAKLAGRGNAVPGSVVSHNSANPQKRFNVYCNNAIATLTEALRGRYPVVERLVGEAFFKAAAHRFAVENPPHSPALFEFGGGFPDFLAAFEPAQTLPYLPDVARLEWLRHVAYHAPDAEPMQTAALGDVPPEHAGGIVPRLHPSVRLLISDYPVVSIWETNFADEVVRRIGPDMAAEAALILRPRLEVKVMRLGPGGAIFLAEIERGARLAVAEERATRGGPDFSLAEALGALLAAGAFVGFSLDMRRVNQGEHHEKPVFPRC